MVDVQAVVCFQIPSSGQNIFGIELDTSDDDKVLFKIWVDVREGKTVVVEIAGVEVGVTIIDEEWFCFELEEIPKDAVDEEIMIADVELSNWTELVKSTVIEIGVDDSNGVLLRVGEAVSIAELVTGLNDEESMVDAVLFSGQ